MLTITFCKITRIKNTDIIKPPCTGLKLSKYKLNIVCYMLQLFLIRLRVIVKLNL